MVPLCSYLFRYSYRGAQLKEPQSAACFKLQKQLEHVVFYSVLSSSTSPLDNSLAPCGGLNSDAVLTSFEGSGEGFMRVSESSLSNSSLASPE